MLTFIFEFGCGLIYDCALLKNPVLKKMIHILFFHIMSMIVFIILTVKIKGQLIFSINFSIYV